MVAQRMLNARARTATVSEQLGSETSPVDHDRFARRRDPVAEQLALDAVRCAVLRAADDPFEHGSNDPCNGCVDRRLVEDLGRLRDQRRPIISRLAQPAQHDTMREVRAARHTVRNSTPAYRSLFGCRGVESTRSLGGDMEERMHVRICAYAPLPCRVERPRRDVTDAARSAADTTRLRPSTLHADRQRRERSADQGVPVSPPPRSVLSRSRSSGDLPKLQLALSTSPRSSRRRSDT
jgi:hypothetical protein